LSPAISVAEILQDLESVDKQISIAVTSKLKIIQSQIEHLQREALRIIEDARVNVDLHSIQCSFQKRIGIVYFLYEKEDSTQFFSILSPEDWGNMLPGKFKAAFKLESDMTWSEVF